MRFNKHKLKELREARGFTQHELALVVGVQEHTVYAWEYGRRTPSLAGIGRVASALGVSPFELLEVKRNEPEA